MLKKLQQWLAVLLAMVMALSSPVSALANNTAGDELKSYLAEQPAAEKRYSVPVTVINGKWEEYASETPTLASAVSNPRMQVQDRALVTEKADGSYEVRVEYTSYNFWDLVEVIKPEKIGELKTEAEKDTKTKLLVRTPLGNFKKTAQASYLNEENAAAHQNSGYISASMNDYYLSEEDAKTEIGNAAMNTGYLTIRTSDPTKRYAVRGYSSSQANWISANGGIILAFEMDQKQALPDSLTISGESAQVKPLWTNHGLVTAIDGTRDNIDKTEQKNARGVLDSLLADEVSVTKNADGTLKAVFPVKGLETDTELVTSISAASSRSMENLKDDPNLTYMRQEFMNASWENVLSEDQKTVTLNYSDLMEGKLIRISTKDLDEYNARQTSEIKKKYIYASLWLDGYQEQEAELTGEQYIVKANALKASWSSFGNKEAERSGGTFFLMQFKDYALLSKRSDGSWQVRLEYDSYSIWDLVQIVKPEKLTELKEKASDDNAPMFLSMHMGTVDAPASIEDYYDPANAAADIQSGFISDEMNQYYISDGTVKTETANQKKDTGYLYYNLNELDELSSDRLIRYYSSVAKNTKLSGAGTVIRLYPDTAVSVNNDLRLPENIAKSGYVWSNYIKSVYASDSKRDSDETARKLLNSLFENEVEIKRNDDGSVHAVLKIKKNADAEDPVTSIRIAESREIGLISYKEPYIQEYAAVHWSDERYNADTQTIELDFTDLLDAKLFRVSTKEMDRKRKKMGFSDDDIGYYYFGQLWLTEAIQPDEEQLILNNSNAEIPDARLVTTKDAYADGVKFELKQTETLENSVNPKQARQDIESYAKDADSFAIYGYGVYDQSGSLVKPKAQITVDIPVPDFYNDRTLIYYAGANISKWKMPTFGKITERDGKRFLTLTPTDLNDSYISIAFIDPGTPVSEETLNQLDEGYYRVRPTIRISSGLNDGPSMSNPAIDHSEEAILHVKKKGEDYDLYVKYHGIYMGTYAFIGRMRVYHAADSLSDLGENLSYISIANLSDDEREVLGHTAASADDADNLMIDELAPKYQLHYPGRIRLHLSGNYRTSQKGWFIGLQAPYMNVAVGSDIDEEKQAYLQIVSESIAKVDGNVLGGYSNSLLKAEIDNADWWLEKLQDTDEKTKLSESVETAKASYAALKENPDEEKLLAAVDELKKAITEAGGGSGDQRQLTNGTYSVPFKLYRGDLTENVSDVQKEALFDTKAKLLVEDDYMTAELTVDPAHTGEIQSFTFDNGNGKETEAEAIKDGDAVTGYRFKRTYTEEPFELAIKTASDSYAVTVRFAMNVSLAEKITADAESVQALKDLIAQLKSLLETDGAKYTKSTAEKLQAAIDGAELVLNQGGDQIAKDTVDRQTKALNEAKDGLRLVSELKQLLADALEAAKKKLADKDQYTADSVAKLENAVTAAQAVYDAFDTASETDVDAAIDALNAAIAGLSAGQRAVLSALVDEYADLKESDYTADSWTAFKKVYDSAKALLESSDATETQYSAAAENLKEARQKLVQKPVYTEKIQELQAVLAELNGKLSDASAYEETSYAAYTASAAASSDLIQNVQAYNATEDQIQKQITALKLSWNALVSADVLNGTASEAAALSDEGLEFKRVSFRAQKKAQTASRSTARRIASASSAYAYEDADAETYADAALDGNLADGEYAVTYALWQFAENKASMGNPALTDAYPDLDGKQAKLVIEDGAAKLSIGFQSMTFNLNGKDQTGHLLEMFIMDNLKMDDDAIDTYDQLDAEKSEYTDETDDYGPPAGQKYPALLTFDITKWMASKEQYIPVRVNVPVMGASAEQPARLRLYWNTLSLVSGGNPVDPEPSPDTENYEEYLALKSALAAVTGELAKTVYTDASQTALVKSSEAASALLNYTKDTEKHVTKTMLTTRTAALPAAEAARILKQGETDPDTPDAVDMRYLLAAIKSAQAMLQNSSQYTEESVRNLRFELEIALAMSSDTNASKEEVSQQTAVLKQAIMNLKAAEINNGGGSGSGGGSTDDSGSDEDDGYYTVSVALWHASMNKASMGNAAVQPKAYVHIEDGEVTMRLVTKKMTTSGITTHLYDFFVYNDGDYESADLVSTENSKWIFEFKLPNDNDRYYKVKVDPRVDVMGTDPVKARLKVTWSTLKEVDEDKWDTLDGDTSSSDSGTSSGSSAASTELTSSETGIKVSGSFSGPGVVLEAARTESTAANNALSGKVSRFVLYDIKLRSGSNYVQPTGSVTIKVPVPVEYDTAKLALYRISDDGTAVRLNGSLNGGYYEASADKLGMYALAESTEVQTAAVTSAGTSSGTSSGNGTVSGSTGSTGSTGRSTSSSGNTYSSGSTGGRTSTTVSAGSTGNTGSAVNAAQTSADVYEDGFEDDTYYAADGRSIPYTGDRMPVAGLSFLLLLSLGGAGAAALSERKYRGKRRAKAAGAAGEC